ncbi:MAG: hypothetical protein KIH64_007600 [Mycobacterium sp.]|nr:hypothetical protein [Mycobacterium sp.]
MGTGRLWGAQYPFERNALQRNMTLIALGGVFVAALLLIARVDLAAVLGISLMGAGVISVLAAVSRLRYVRESRMGFDILNTRGGGFVSGSALAFGVVGVLVAALILFK